jgi:hypothetical protein
MQHQHQHQHQHQRTSDLGGQAGGQGMADEPLPLPDLPPSRPAPGAGTGDTVAAHEAKGRRRGEASIWRRNPRDQGLIGVTDALAWFGSQGWAVAIPLIDNQPYDLVVDDGSALHRVQVKTTTQRSRYGRFVVQLETTGGNQSFHTRKAFDASRCDLLYVLTDDRDRYLIPTTAITARSSLTLGSRVEPYRLRRP